MRLEAHLRDRRAAGRSLLVPYVTGGLGSGWLDVVRAVVDAGADAVEVGTATLADPRAPWKVQDATRRWCARHDVTRLLDLKGALDG